MMNQNRKTTLGVILLSAALFAGAANAADPTTDQAPAPEQPQPATAPAPAAASPATDAVPPPAAPQAPAPDTTNAVVPAPAPVREQPTLPAKADSAPPVPVRSRAASAENTSRSTVHSQPVVSPRSVIEAPSLPAPAPVEAPVPSAKTAAGSPSEASGEPPSTGAAQTDSVSAQQASDAVRGLDPFVVPTALLVLALMSVAAWLSLRSKSAEQQEFMQADEQMKNTFWRAGSLAQAVQSLAQGSPFRYVAEAALRATESKADNLGGKINYKVWMVRVIQHAGGNVEGRMGTPPDGLIAIAVAAPLVGVLAAAWALAIAPALTATPGPAGFDVLAVGGAVVAMVLGLAVAVQAMLGYNRAAARGDVCVRETRAFCSDLQQALLGGLFDPLPGRVAAVAGAR